MNVRYLLLSCSVLFCLTSFSQKYNAELLSYNTSIEVESSALTVSKSLTIQINNMVGDEYAIFSIPYSKDIKIGQLKAWIEDGSGNVIRQLKKSDIIDRNEFSDDLYVDRFIKIFQMKHNSYPYKVVCEYSYTHKNYMHICDWSPVVFNDIPTAAAKLSVSIPLDIEYNQYIKDLPDHKSDTVESRVTMEFKSSCPAPVKGEIYSLPTRNIPTVTIVPMYFKNENEGSWKSWQEYGDWVYSLIDGQDLLTETELSTVQNLVKGMTNKREVVTTLYHYLQDHTRYINVSIGIGALKPYPAEYVCRNKYGDCKALSNYMKAILKSVGIESFYSIIQADEFPDDFLSDFPSHQFNHIVLMVPIEKDTLWLENTSSINPLGYVGSGTQNRYALVIRQGNSKLIKLPELTDQNVIEKKIMVFELSKEGSAKVKIHNEYRGDDFETLNGLATHLNDDDKDRIIRKSMLFDNYEVTGWKIIKHHRDSASISLDVDLTLNKVLNPLGSDLYFTLNSTGIPSFTNPASRKLPVFIPYPIYIIDTLVYNLPESFSLKNQFAPVNITSDFGKYELTIIPGDKTVTAIKKFELYRGDYTLARYPEFFKFIDSANKADKSKIVIKQL
jgi:hypothetical protein